MSIAPLSCLSFSAFHLIIDLYTITQRQILKDHLFLANEIEKSERLHSIPKLTQQTSNNESGLYLDVLWVFPQMSFTLALHSPLGCHHTRPR